MLKLLLLLALTMPALAQQPDCECLWQGSFAEVQADTDLVISGTVIDSKGNSVDLAIDSVLRGPVELDSTRIWMKTAHYCRPQAEAFAIGSQWVMALHRIDDTVPGGFNPSTPSVSYGRVGDYSLSSCGGYWLQQTGNVVTGNLVNAPRWVREPKMTPVLLELLVSYVNGGLSIEALAEASREDPALREMMLDTRAFLRGDED
jgi:hypothetical protein